MKKQIVLPLGFKRLAHLACIGLLATCTLSYAGLRQKHEPDLGPGANLNGKQVFPADDPWNEDISGSPVDPNSDVIVKGIGLGKPLHADFGTVYNGAPNGIPYMIVPGDQPRVPITFGYADESDKGPYPIPANAPIEGGPNSTGDRHILIIDRDHWKLYEVDRAFPVIVNNQIVAWKGDSGAKFDLATDKRRPLCWTSADAAGLPIFPGLARYEEAVTNGVITHALRFTISKSRRAFIDPARHFASSKTDADLPPMGMRVRLKASYDISGFKGEAKVILTALKKYGMIVADNGGDWYISGAPDPRWNDDTLGSLRDIKGRDFEVVQMNDVVTSCK